MDTNISIRTLLTEKNKIYCCHIGSQILKICKNHALVQHIFAASLCWRMPLLESYENDLRAAQAEGRNLLAEKYGYMMMWTSPKEFKEVRDLLPQVTDEKKGRVLRIAAIHMDWQKEIAKKYPALSQKGRRITQDGSLSNAVKRSYFPLEKFLFHSYMISP